MQCSIWRGNKSSSAREKLGAAVLLRTYRVDGPMLLKKHDSGVLRDLVDIALYDLRIGDFCGACLQVPRCRLNLNQSILAITKGPQRLGFLALYAAHRHPADGRQAPWPGAQRVLDGGVALVSTEDQTNGRVLIGPSLLCLKVAHVH